MNASSPPPTTPATLVTFLPFDVVTYLSPTSSTNDNNTNMTSSSPNGTTLMTWPKECLVFPRVPGKMPWDNPEDLVSRATHDVLHAVSSMGLLTVLFLVGCPANIVNAIVFFKQGLKERINLLLFSLSVTDFLVVALHFAWTLDWLVQFITQDFRSLPVYRVFINNHVIGLAGFIYMSNFLSMFIAIARRFCVVKNGPVDRLAGFIYMSNFLSMVIAIDRCFCVVKKGPVDRLAGFIYMSNFLSMVIAIDRCFCVVSPLRARSLLSAKATAAVILLVLVVIVGGHFVIAAAWEVVCSFDPLTGIVEDIVFSSQFYADNKGLLRALDGVVFGFLIPGVCLAGVTIATVVTVVRLNKMTAWRNQSVAATSASTLSSKDVALTRMLIGISWLYIVCTTPPFVFHVTYLFVPELSHSGKYYNTYNTCIVLQQALTFVNCSVNFIIYFTTGSIVRYRIAIP